MWNVNAGLVEIDSLIIGKKKNPGMQLRLVENSKGKRYIQLWSNLSKQWLLFYRYNVNEAWVSWKKIAKGIKK